MHFVEIVRQPLLGQPIVWRHWVVVGVISVVGTGVALFGMRNYRSRVAYWV
jgi:ABC-2 type transport system permease protein